MKAYKIPNKSILIAQKNHFEKFEYICIDKIGDHGRKIESNLNSFHWENLIFW